MQYKSKDEKQISHSASLRAGSSGMTTRKAEAKAKAKQKADPPPAAKDDN
jgi:hypothetical protein